MVFPLACHRHFKHNQSNREILTLPINLTNKYWFICYQFISQLIWKSSLNITTIICPKPSLYPPRFNSQTSPISSIQNTSQIYLLFSLFPLPLLSHSWANIITSSASVRLYCHKSISSLHTFTLVLCAPQSTNNNPSKVHF